MSLSRWAWVDSLGYRWEAVQPASWAASMRSQGYVVTFLEAVSA